MYQNSKQDGRTNFGKAYNSKHVACKKKHGASNAGIVFWAMILFTGRKATMLARTTSIRSITGNEELIQ